MREKQRKKEIANLIYILSAQQSKILLMLLPSLLLLALTPKLIMHLHYKEGGVMVLNEGDEVKITSSIRQIPHLMQKFQSFLAYLMKLGYNLSITLNLMFQVAGSRTICI